METFWVLSTGAGGLAGGRGAGGIGHPDVGPGGGAALGASDSDVSAVPAADDGGGAPLPEGYAIAAAAAAAAAAGIEPTREGPLASAALTWPGK